MENENIESHLLNSENQKRLYLLQSWYGSKDYKKFLINHPIKDESKYDWAISQMGDWFNSINLNSAPKLFINGYPLPDPYSVNDLNEFLSLLIDHFKTEMSNPY